MFFFTYILMLYYVMNLYSIYYYHVNYIVIAAAVIKYIFRNIYSAILLQEYDCRPK